MSAAEVEAELKAGHPPAVKAGGMRITQSGKTPEKPAAGGDKASKEDDDYVEEPPPPKADPASLLISGAPSRGNKDFPPEAVKSYHEKPLPTHSKPSAGHKPSPHMLNQPRK